MTQPLQGLFASNVANDFFIQGFVSKIVDKLSSFLQSLVEIYTLCILERKFQQILLFYLKAKAFEEEKNE